MNVLEPVLPPCRLSPVLRLCEEVLEGEEETVVGDDPKRRLRAVSLNDPGECDGESDDGVVSKLSVRSSVRCAPLEGVLVGVRGVACSFGGEGGGRMGREVAEEKEEEEELKDEDGGPAVTRETIEEGGGLAMQLEVARDSTLDTSPNILLSLMLLVLLLLLSSSSSSSFALATCRTILVGPPSSTSTSISAPMSAQGLNSTCTDSMLSSVLGGGAHWAFARSTFRTSVDDDVSWTVSLSGAWLQLIHSASRCSL